MSSRIFPHMSRVVACERLLLRCAGNRTAAREYAIERERGCAAEAEKYYEAGLYLQASVSEDAAEWWGGVASAIVGDDDAQR